MIAFLVLWLSKSKLKIGTGLLGPADGIVSIFIDKTFDHPHNS